MTRRHTAIGVRNDLTRNTGAWIEGDSTGARRFVNIGEVHLESGGSLPVTVAFETWGTLNSDASNAVLVLHALTGDSHVAGSSEPTSPAGWWQWLVGPGKPIDTSEYFVVCPNVLGGCQGTTGPASLAPDGSRFGSRFPRITIRDQVAVEHALADWLEIDAWALVIGGSVGGMRALEWAVSFPARVRAAAILASTAGVSGDVIAWNHAQLSAITSAPEYQGGDYYETPGPGPRSALGVARRIAMATYRTAVEFDSRFTPAVDSSRMGPFDAESYLDHHARTLADRFDAGSYVTLVRAMNTHRIGAGRGGTDNALAKVRARTLVISIDSDRLFPVAQNVELAEGIEGARHVTVSSEKGHDAFLVEHPVIRSEVLALLRGA